ncbi:adhesion lipoprotein with mutiple fasciclin domains [Psychroflexus torquis ATCC 700755]|uniref:Adhesion lipoprotein with mutiple fasciclin domains n=1 Tax=Psychroflexus torquis (strain ATCC 700755 / CIP 106069 / ACAM 623) TaxID=313595 RepID=K4IEE7_PSYTT|nr:fasciclin domain-containing protein [Psychroflexus torquis]AFU68223.1 adhesion lipoprotein with mutiple fasciclin domains [Psychroflexus torquis ATCC 700755]
MKLLPKFLLVAFLASAFVSCSDDDDAPAPPQGDPTIAEFVAENDDFSSLGAALEVAGLVGVLNGTDEYTVFAPNNTAFTAFLQANGFSSLGEVPVDLLTKVLLNHVVVGTNLSTDLTTGYISSLAVGSASASGLSLFINTENGVVINGGANNGGASVFESQVDILVSNGVIHAVENVIGLPDVTNQAIANPQFSTLVSALIAASTDQTNYVDILSGSESSPFTVFAPTNAAFDDLLSGLGASSLSDVAPATLATILEYHVIAGSNVRSSDLTTGLTAATLQGEELEFDLSNGAQVMDATEANANIAIVDVQTNNGVVHAIDKVLLPQVIVDVIDPTITGLAMMNDDLSSLFAALQLTGLDEVLNDRASQYTVFAPTNAAFDIFLNGSALGDLPVEVVTQVLLNHVLAGTVLSTDLETTYTNSLATFGGTENNLSFYINLDNGVRLNGVSSVTAPDNEAANGVVHIVDAVIGLPTVVTFATADPNFSSLVAALTDDGQEAQNYVETLSTPNGTAPAPFTVFAPINSAFDNLFAELGVEGIEDIDPATLTAALNTHVVAGFNVRSTDLTNGTVSTLGADLTVDATAGTLTDPNDRVSTIAVFDVQAANGVVHAIDTVLLPQL